MTKTGGKGKYHALMVILIILWGIEASVAREVLVTVDSVTLMNFRYLMGAVVLAVVVGMRKKFKMIRLRDLPIFIGSVLAGHIVFYLCEYTAIKIIPVANWTVLLGFVPACSVLVERVVFHRRASVLMVLCIFICIGGLAMTIGGDSLAAGSGKVLGYLLCGGGVACWVVYLFLTEALQEYDSACVALYQVIIATLMTAPYAVTHLPTSGQWTPALIGQLLFLGIIGEGFGFLIEVTGIQKLGSTISGVYSNFLPVTTAIFGLILLGQSLTVLQIAGGIVVIISGCVVIREKSRL